MLNDITNAEKCSMCGVFVQASLFDTLNQIVQTE